MKSLDAFLDAFTMYRVVIYGLGLLALYSVLLSLFGLVLFSALSLLASLVVITVTIFAFHYLFAKIYHAPANIESSLISALILFFIAMPPESLKDTWWLIFVSASVIISKYVIAYKNRHIFNPVAFALVIAGLFGWGGAFWWVGSLYMLPAVAVVGLLIVKKIRRSELFFTYILVSTAAALVVGLFSGQHFLDILLQHFVSWPTIFFGAIMLTEPFTTPPTKKLQITYAVIVGIIASVPFHAGVIFSTPELALVLGNIFSYAVSLKVRLVLTFKERIQIAKDTYEFIFAKSDPLPHYAGQYMEWTLPHESPDLRGIRRYFTIASSPNDENVRLGVKMSPEGAIGSSFKKKLFSLLPGERLTAAGVSGDFTLPSTTDTKLVFIAGGIGITPFASMLRHLIDTQQKRHIILFYANKIIDDIAYNDVVLKAKEEMNLEIVDILSDQETLPQNWNGEVGFITQEMVAKHVLDWQTCLYYLSGPQKMVTTYKEMLLAVGIPRNQIVTDYFPGFV